MSGKVQHDGDFEAEDVDVHLDGHEPELIIEDDAPEGDKGRTLLTPEAEGQYVDPTDEELSQYSDGVRKRFKDLTFRYHDQRRKAEARERETAAAAQYTQQALAELNRTRQLLSEYEKFGVDNASRAATAEHEKAKKDYLDAFNTGDAEKMAEALDRQALARMQMEQLSRYEPEQHQPYQYDPRLLQQAATPQVDPRQTEAFNHWHQRNQWFGQDADMTLWARGWHQMIAENNPAAVGTPEYYQEIDKLIREKYPDRFRSASPAAATSRPSPVTPALRSAPETRSSKKQVIRLTKAQVDLARRLGLTPQQYAEGLREYGDKN